MCQQALKSCWLNWGEFYRYVLGRNSLSTIKVGKRNESYANAVNSWHYIHPEGSNWDPVCIWIEHEKMGCIGRLNAWHHSSGRIWPVEALPYDNELALEVFHITCKEYWDEHSTTDRSLINTAVK